MNPEDILKLHQKHNIKMLFLNPIFQNPTGTILPIEKRKRVLKITAELGIPVVEDDPYSLVSFSEEIDTSSLKSIDDKGSVLYISSFSKIAASGLRIGWIIGPDKIIQRLADAKQQIDFGHSIFPQWLASEYIQSDYFDQNLQSLKERLTEKRNILISSLKEELTSELSFHVPEGGIHIWCRLHGDVNEFQLLEESLRNGVAFVPGSLFGSEKGYIRLTFGRVDSHLISEGVQRLKRSFEKLKE